MVAVLVVLVMLFLQRVALAVVPEVCHITPIKHTRCRMGLRLKLPILHRVMPEAAKLVIFMLRVGAAVAVLEKPEPLIPEQIRTRLELVVMDASMISQAKMSGMLVAVAAVVAVLLAAASVVKAVAVRAVIKMVRKAEKTDATASEVAVVVLGLLLAATIIPVRVATVS